MPNNLLYFTQQRRRSWGTERKHLNKLSQLKNCGFDLSRYYVLIVALCENYLGSFLDVRVKAPGGRVVCHNMLYIV